MMSQRVSLVLGALGLLALGGLAGRVLATGVPTASPLVWAGVVTDQAGKPYPTAVDVQVAFFDKPDATVPVCQAGAVKAEAGTGRFQVMLPAECAQAVHAGPDLWSEAKVGSQALPRVKVGAVPYALEADTASQAGGALKLAVDGHTADLGTLKSDLPPVKADIATLKADVAALKQAPPGGGGGDGPWVVDSKGTKVGRFVGIEYVVGSYYSDVFDVVTSAGYLVRVTPAGKFLEVSIGYTGSNCTGDAYLFVSGTLTNRRAWYDSFTKSFWVPKGNPGGYSPSSNWTQKSSSNGTGGLCDNYNSPGKSGVSAKPMAASDLGLPAGLVPPMTLAP